MASLFIIRERWLDAVKAELSAMDDDLAKAEASIAAATKRLALQTQA